MKARLTSHAQERLTARTALTEPELLDMLDNSFCVPLGTEGRSQKVHKLVGNAQDENCFIVVQDEANGEVVTILSLDYHNRWNIDISAVKEARRLATAWRYPPEQKAKKDPPAKKEQKKGPAHRPVSVIKVSMLAVVEQRFLRRNVESVKFEEYNGRMAERLASAEVLKRVETLLARDELKIENCHHIILYATVGSAHPVTICEHMIFPHRAQ